MTKYEICSKMALDQRWLERGVLAIDARQTQDEQAGGETRYDNGRGWSKADANFGGSLAAWIRGGRRVEGLRLSVAQAAAARRMMRKYAGQLARIAESKAAAVPQLDDDVIDAEYVVPQPQRLLTA